MRVATSMAASLASRWISQAVVLNLDEVTVAEQVVKPGRDVAGFLDLLFNEPAADFAGTAGERARLNSPLTQPLRQMIPSEYSSTSTRSIRGL